MGCESRKKPTFFSFNNTERCRSRCITCNCWQNPENIRDKELTTDEWKKILYDIHKWTGGYEFIISGGEPFIRSDIFEIAKYASDLGDTVNVITNGLELSGRINELFDSAFTNITFSLNAIKDPSIHNKSRGREDAFKLTVDAIQNTALLKRTRTRQKPKNIFISTIVMPSDLSELKPLAEFCKTEEIGISYQLLDNGDAFTSELSNESAISDTDIKTKAISALDEIIEMKHLGFPICNSYEQLEAFKILISSPEKIQDTECRVGDNNFAIDPYGNCRICFCMEPVGNLKESSPEDIWNGEKAERTRELVKQCKKSCRLLNCNFKRDE